MKDTAPSNWACKALIQAAFRAKAPSQPSVSCVSFPNAPAFLICEVQPCPPSPPPFSNHEKGGGDARSSTHRSHVDRGVNL